MFSAPWVKAYTTMVAFPFFKIVANRHRFSAFATINRVRTKLTLRPLHHLMPSRLSMTLITRIKLATASKLDRNDINFLLVMNTACFFVNWKPMYVWQTAHSLVVRKGCAHRSPGTFLSVDDYF